jgi:hypothetical protein
MWPPAALLSCIRGCVRKTGVVAYEDFQVKSDRPAAGERSFGQKLRAACN